MQTWHAALSNVGSHVKALIATVRDSNWTLYPHIVAATITTFKPWVHFCCSYEPFVDVQKMVYLFRPADSLSKADAHASGMAPHWMVCCRV